MLLGYRELLTQHILVGPSTKCVYGSLIIYISTSQIGPFSPQVFLFFSFFGYKPTSLDFTYHALKPMKSYYTVYGQLPLSPFILFCVHTSTLIGNNRHWYSSHSGPPFTWCVILISFLWMSTIVFIRLCKIVNCKWAESSWVLQIQN